MLLLSVIFKEIMKQRNSFSILCFLFLSFIVASVSAQECMNTGNFTPNSAYDVNRRLILSSLPPNVTFQSGFFNGWTGQEPNQVYAMGMCIPGADTNDCFECIKTGSNELIQRCPNQTNAFYWKYTPTLCYIRYSNTSFLGSGDLDPHVLLFNTGNIRSNLTEFSEIWEDLTVGMIREASRERSTRVSNDNHYEADVATLATFESIYALMLCTPDLSTRDCNNCLRQSAGDYRSCCGSRPGGFVLRPSCLFRWEMYPFSRAFDDFIVSPSIGDRANTTSNDGENISTGKMAAIVGVPAIVVVILFALGFAIYRRRKTFTTENDYFSIVKRLKKSHGTAPTDEVADDITAVSSLQLDFKAIEAATSNFDQSNKLGQGGFGEVYKGTYRNGTEVAVKRLSKNSSQGEQEFKNEVLLVAKLQHRNLVRLLGFSVQGEEKILVYEFVPNKSLDYFLFDPVKRCQLDWTRRSKIIRGITRGILYLHQDSRLTIIHRDLKASNILLDADMNPKIADFGMARNFKVDQTEANTGRVVGTLGYMPPEYVTNGHFSTKSDVYSFGVLILEIIGGKKNSKFHQIEGSVCNLVTYVWRLWNNESLLELVDETMEESYEKDEVIRCIHVGLLCVQENPADRPTMATIYEMLTNTYIILDVPQPPGFLFRVRTEVNPLAEGLQRDQSTSKSVPCSIDDGTITSVDPR